MAKRKNNQLETLPLAAQADKEGRIHKDSAFRFQEGLSITLEKAESGGPRKFRMVALSGKPFAHPWWGTLAFDLKGLKPAGQKIPILRQHDPNRPIGFTTAVDVGDRVEIEGVLSASMADAKDIETLADEGFPWQASVGLDFPTFQFVARDEEAEVNGTKLKGPATIFRKATIRETSFVPLGADPRTHAEVLSAADPATVQSLFAAYSSKPEDPETGGSMANEKIETTQPPPAAPTIAPLAAASPAQPTTVPLTAADIQRLVAEGVAAAVKTFAQGRTAKLSKLREIAFSNQEALALELADSDKSIEDCMVALVKDAKERGGKQLAALQKDPAKGVQAGDGDQQASFGGIAPTDAERALITERGTVDLAKAKAQFAASQELKDEFGDEASFLGYLKATAAGTHKFTVLQGTKTA